METEKIVSIEDRIPKLRQMRKKKANRKLLFYLSIFFILIMIIVYLESPFSNINEISIEGNRLVEYTEILELGDLSTDVNIWAINQRLIEEKILHHPMIKGVKVERALPQSIKIEIEEFKMIGFKQDGAKLFPILSNGEIVTVNQKLYVGEAPLLNNFEDDQYLHRMAEELNQLPIHIFNLISEISWVPTEKNKYKIVLFMNDGFVVNATIRNFASKMDVYPSVVSQLDPAEKGVVHMGVGTYYESLEKLDDTEDTEDFEIEDE